MKDINITSEADENNDKIFKDLETIWKNDDFTAYPSDVISKELYTQDDTYREAFDQLASTLLKASHEYKNSSLALRVEKINFISELKEILKQKKSVSSGYGETMELEKKYKKLRDEDIEK